jgi:DNA-binding LacI/PurR family transcriptional regulator
VLAGPGAVVSGNPFLNQLLAGIAAQLAERDLQLALFVPQREEDVQRLASYLGRGHVDGVLLACFPDWVALYDRLANTGIPMVACGKPPGAPAASYVDTDNEGGAVLAVEHLVEQGCRQIAAVAGPPGTPLGPDGLARYRIALRRAELPADKGLIGVGDFTAASGRYVTAGMLAARPGIDGLFVAGQPMACGALEALRRLGRSIPRDVAVVGFGDLPGQAADPPLTSIRQPGEQMGREMTRLLLAQLDDTRPIARQVLLGTHLVIRQSSQRHPTWHTSQPAPSSPVSPSTRKAGLSGEPAVSA